MVLALIRDLIQIEERRTTCNARQNQNPTHSKNGHDRELEVKGINSHNLESLKLWVDGGGRERDGEESGRNTVEVLTMFSLNSKAKANMLWYTQVKLSK
ncbi:hypothetical protein GIB67_034019 [Kingdonia uniflora]|uniref:Uncharacterized protein n=1 Tax=Kingdonia uniflora TaxID=39325 RepID=A0A7J7M685_9MAGN|nr:hypothetical protein GIB67_034019 [Kingdonia uniflora]